MKGPFFGVLCLSFSDGSVLCSLVLRLFRPCGRAVCYSVSEIVVVGDIFVFLGRNVFRCSCVFVAYVKFYNWAGAGAIAVFNLCKSWFAVGRGIVAIPRQ